MATHPTLAFTRSFDIAKFMKLMNNVNCEYCKSAHRFTVNKKPATGAIWDGSTAYIIVKESTGFELIRYNVDRDQPVLLQTSPEPRVEQAIIKMLQLAILPSLLLDNIDDQDRDDTRDVILDDIDALFDYINEQAKVNG